MMRFDFGESVSVAIVKKEARWRSGLFFSKKLHWVKMKLKYKLLIILAVSILAYQFILTYSANLVVLKDYEEIEDQQVYKNLTRLRETIQDSVNQFRITSSSWSSSKNFMKFLDSDSMFDSKISDILIYSRDLKLSYAKSYNLKTRSFSKIQDQKLIDIKNKFSQSLQKKPSDITTGFYLYGDKFHFYSLNPIVNKGQLGGYVIFLREMNDFTRIQALIKYPLTHFMIDNNKPEVRIDIHKIPEYQEANLILPDIGGKKALTLQLTIPRNIYLLGVKNISYLIKLVVIGLIFISCAVYFITMFYLVEPIQKLRDELQNISNNKSRSQRVSVETKDEIGSLALNINNTLDTLEQNQKVINQNSKLSSLGEMAGSIAHEINNPLTIISGYTSRIRHQVESENPNLNLIGDYAKKVHATVFRIEKIIKSLRSIARNGEEDPTVDTPVGNIIDDVYFLSQMTLKNKSIALDINKVDPNLIISVRAVQISQVVINLINNAVDAIEKLENPQIKIETYETQDEVVISVSDTGKIPSDVAEKIMTPFFTTKDVGKGTGLGLSISKSIIESHGGQFYLDMSMPNTCFKMTFPKKKAAPMAA